MNPDQDARKQLLLTRIAVERLTLRSDTARIKRAVSLPQLLRSAISFTSFGRTLFGTGKTPTDAAGWLATALSLVRRYRVAAALLGSLAPILSGRKPMRRLLRLATLATLGAGLWFGRRATQRREPG